MGRSLKALLSDKDGGAFKLASNELIKAVGAYEEYVKNSGIDESVIEAYLTAAKVAMVEEEDHKYGIKVTKRGKELIEQYVVNLTGGTIWDLEKYAQKNGSEYELIDKYYGLLKLESYEWFESCIRHMDQKRP